MQVLVIVLVAREVRYIPALPYPVACRFGGLIDFYLVMKAVAPWHGGTSPNEWSSIL